MFSGQILITHPNGCQQALPFRAGVLRLGSAPDNDLVLAGPGIAPYHATVRCAEYGDVLISLDGQAAGSSAGGVEIELPRAFAPAALVRIGGYMLRYLSSECVTMTSGHYVLRAEAMPWSAACDVADDETMLLRELLDQYATADPGDAHEAVTIEMPAYREANAG